MPASKDVSRLFVVSLLISSILSQSAYGLEEDVQVTARVQPEYKIVVSALSSPFSIVHSFIKQNSISIGDYIANKSGQLSFNLDLNLGSESTICFNAQDIIQIETDSVCYELNSTVKNGLLSDVVLPPTISIKYDLLESKLVVYGFTVPNAKVVILIDGVEASIEESSDLGYYQYELNQTSGSHNIQAYATKDDIYTPHSKLVSYDTNLITNCRASQFTKFIDRLIFELENYWWVIIIIFELILIYFLIWKKSKVDSNQKPKKEQTNSASR